MSSFDPAHPIAERNLIFAGIALEKGLIETHHINHAFTLWICNKSQPLGDILVEMKVLTPEQKQEIDQEVSQKLAKEIVTVLSTMDCLEDLSSEVNFLDDSDLKLTLGDAKKAKAAETPPVPESPAHPESKGKSDSTSKQDSIPKSGPVPPETSGSDRFEPVDYLASQGGMGELWRSKDKELNRYVVVKYIKRYRAQDPHLRGLFHLEGEVTGHLEHPNIPPVYSLGKDTLSRDYFAMRYFKGRKLTEEIRDYHGIPHHNHSERKEKLVELLQSFQTACLTVEFAHNRGIIHCDIKPDNIMVGEYGETLVIDWGLVVVKGAQQPIDHDAVTQTRYAENINYFNPSKSASSGLHVKQGGSRKWVGGTLAYMPPEQLKATEAGDINLITFASDVFGLGATLYHLLVGRAPYLPKTKEKETKSHFYDRIRKADFQAPRSVNPEIPKPLESIVKKAMACDPKQRYATPRELADDIRRWLSDEPTRAHPEGFGLKLGRWLKKNRKTATVAGTLLISSLLIGGFLVYREQQRTLEYAKQASLLASYGFGIVEKFEPFLVSEANIDEQRKKTLINSSKTFSNLMEYGNQDIKTKLLAANAFRYTANIHRFDFEHEKAKDLYSKSIAIYQSILGSSDDERLTAIFYARVLVDLGQLHASLGEWNEALKVTNDAEKIIESYYQNEAVPIEINKFKSQIYLAQSGINFGNNKNSTANDLVKKSIYIYEEIEKNKLLRSYDFILFCSALTLYGSILRESGELLESEKVLKKARDLLNPFYVEIQANPIASARDVSKIDIMITYGICKMSQNETFLKLNKSPDELERSLAGLIKLWTDLQANGRSSPRISLLLSKTYILKSQMYKKNLIEYKKTLSHAKGITQDLIAINPKIFETTMQVRKIRELESD